VTHTVTLPVGCPDWGGGQYSGSTSDPLSTGLVLSERQGTDSQGDGSSGLSVLVQVAGPAVLQGTGVLAAWA
jgi:hypothetical protein